MIVIGLGFAAAVGFISAMVGVLRCTRSSRLPY